LDDGLDIEPSKPLKPPELRIHVIHLELKHDAAGQVFWDCFSPHDLSIGINGPEAEDARTCRKFGIGPVPVWLRVER
jgi:hypothetical protein